MVKNKIKSDKNGITILISIILTIILVSTVNVGITLFLGELEYNDFCDYSKPSLQKENLTQNDCERENGTWYYEGNYCDFYTRCHEQYNEAMKPMNQNRFYILAILGFGLLLFGLFTKELLIQITGLSTGGILVFQGIVLNLHDKLVVFIALLAILIIFGILALRVIKIHK
jgi:hypothetical protein